MGPWRLQPWARHSVTGSCLATLIGWLKTAPLASDSLHLPPFVLMNLLILLILFYYPDIGAALGEKEYAP